MIPEELHRQLARHGVTASDEVALREALEAHTETYTLIKLAGRLVYYSHRVRC